MNEDSAPLIRRSRRKVSYTAIANAIIDHPQLSADARLALIYLLSKPDDWQVQIDDLRRMLGAGDRRCGRDKVYAVLKELKVAGYVVLTTEAQKNGQFRRTIYHVFDEPCAAPTQAACDPVREEREPGLVFNDQLPEARSSTPAVTSPLPEKPDPEKPDPENPHATKNGEIQTTEFPPSPPTTPTQKRHTEFGEVDPGGGFASFWDRWPVSLRPRSRAAAERCFRRLPNGDRLLAWQYADQYRSMQTARSRMPFMIPYLRLRGFMDVVDAPPIDGRYFAITPDRPEWSAWMADCRKRCSEAIVAAQEAKGILLTTTRWPPSDGADPARRERR